METKINSDRKNTAMSPAMASISECRHAIRPRYAMLAVSIPAARVRRLPRRSTASATVKSPPSSAKPANDDRNPRASTCKEKDRSSHAPKMTMIFSLAKEMKKVVNRTRVEEVPKKDAPLESL